MPKQINFFTFAKRPMTVIDGIAYYFSTGMNSEQANTCFPHLGISFDDRFQIIKPLNQLPNNVIDFINNNGFSKDIEWIRFGTIRTLCVSASIGTGFWETADGKKLRIFLAKNYAYLFLSTEASHKMIKHKNDAGSKVFGNNIDDVIAANKLLYKMGAITLLPDRIPEEDELILLQKTRTEKGKITEATKALSSLISLTYTLDENTYNAIIKLEKANLLEYTMYKNGVHYVEQMSDIISRNTLSKIAKKGSYKITKRLITYISNSENITKNDINNIDNSLNDIETRLATHLENLQKTTSKAHFLPFLEAYLNELYLTKEDILDLFDEIKKKNGLFKSIHSTSITHRCLLLFKNKVNPDDDEKKFWHTPLYQDAIKLLKKAYLNQGLLPKNTPYREMKDRENAFMDYVRGNAPLHKKQTDSRREVEKRISR